MNQHCGAVFHDREGQEFLCTLPVHHKGEHDWPALLSSVEPAKECKECSHIPCDCFDHAEAGVEVERQEGWTLNLHTDADGRSWATLHESGKMDTVVEVSAGQLPWFNALKALIRGVSNGL